MLKGGWIIGKKNEEFLNEEKIHKKGKILKKSQMEKRGNLKVIKPSAQRSFRIQNSTL